MPLIKLENQVCSFKTSLEIEKLLGKRIDTCYGYNSALEVKDMEYFRKYPGELIASAFVSQELGVCLNTVNRHTEEEHIEYSFDEINRVWCVDLMSSFCEQKIIVTDQCETESRGLMLIKLLKEKILLPEWIFMEIEDLQNQGYLSKKERR